MSSDLSLFGDDPEEQLSPPTLPARPEDEIAGWLVDSVRQALDAQGLTEMAERQEAIEAVTGRPVESLRALTRAEALRVLAELTPKSGSKARTAGSWEQREGDTWIDRI